MADNTEITEINFEDLVLLNDQSLSNETDEIQFSLEDLAKKEEIPEEKKEEEKPEEVKTEETPKPEEKDNPEQKELTNFSTIAKKLLDKGEWADVTVEDEKGEEKKLSEIENLDEETFMSIWQEQAKFSKEDFEKDHISVKGIDEDKRKIINIIKEGGDLKTIFENESQLKKPFDGLDLEDQSTQQTILYNQYLRQGIGKEDAKDLVLKSTKELTLDTKVSEIVTFFQKKYDENLSNLEKEAKEIRIKEQEAIKEYKKTINSLYKEDGLEDSLVKTLVEAGTKYDKDGNLVIDTVYESLMKDPKEAKELIFFMLEKEKYLTKKGASIKRETQIGDLRKIKVIRETAKSSETKPEVEDNKNEPFGNIVLE